MNVYIRFSSEDYVSLSPLYLNELATLIETDYDFLVQRNIGEAQQGSKDSSLIVGLTIIRLTLGALATLYTVLSYQQAKEPKYSISIADKNTTFSIENLTLEQFKEKVVELESLKVLISPKEEKQDEGK